MKDVAYIQTVNGQFSNINFFTAALAMSKFFGYRVQTFEASELESLPITKDTPVFGGIPIMDKVFKKLGRTVLVPYYPSELNWFLGRNVSSSTVKDFRKLFEDGAEAYFIKPTEKEKKLFTGHVVAKWADLILTAHIESDKSIYISDVLAFKTEYRVFVHRDSGILGVKHYAGDWSIVPNRTLIERAIADFKEGPIAYSLDVGVTEAGITRLVECNDACSLGCYGLDASCYGRMLLDRWNQVMNQNESSR